MDRRRRAAVAGVAWLLAAYHGGCARESVIESSAPALHDAVPVDAGALHLWLIDGGYRHWPGWSEVRPSTVAEGGVRVFWSPGLHRSLLTEAPHHPVGAAAVRELYGDDLRTHRGWSAMVKVGGRGAPDDWLFFEVFSTAAAARPNVAAKGYPGCTGCHEDGVDFVHTTR